MAEPHVDRPDRRPSAPSPQRRRAGRRLTDALATARRVLAFVDGIDPHVLLVTIAQVAVMAAVSRRTIWRDRYVTKSLGSSINRSSSVYHRGGFCRGWIHSPCCVRTDTTLR